MAFEAPKPLAFDAPKPVFCAPKPEAFEFPKPVFVDDPKPEVFVPKADGLLLLPKPLLPFELLFPNALFPVCPKPPVLPNALVLAPKPDALVFLLPNALLLLPKPVFVD